MSALINSSQDATHSSGLSSKISFFVEVEPLQGPAPIQSFQNSITLQGKSRVLSLQLGPPGP